MDSEDDFEPDPPVYTEGIAYQDYDRAMELLQADSSQARLVFGELNETLLHCAAWDGQPALVRMLIEFGANLNAQDKAGQTPLHLAAIYGGDDAIPVLAQAGADLEIQDNGGWTPLMWASISRCGDREKKVETLLACGANLDLNTAVNMDWLDDVARMLETNPDAAHQAPLPKDLVWSAVLGKNFNLVDLLLNHGADPNGVENRPPLVLACNSEGMPLEIVASLLRHGADPTRSDAGGRTAMSLAMQYNRHDIVQLLTR